MKRLIRLIFVAFQALFISFEFLFILSLSFIITVFYDQAVLFGTLIKTNLKAFEYVLFLPPGLLGLFIKEGKSFLFPTKDKFNTLQKLEIYDDLKIHFWVNLIYLLLFSIIAILYGLLGLEIDKPLYLCLLLIAVIGSCISYLSFWKAQINIEEIFSKSNSEIDKST